MAIPAEISFVYLNFLTAINHENQIETIYKQNYLQSFVDTVFINYSLEKIHVYQRNVYLVRKSILSLVSLPVNTYNS